MLRAEAGEFARFLVIDRSRCQVLMLGLVLGCPGVAAGLGNAGTAEHHHCRIDAAFGHDHFRLQQFQLQPHGTQLFTGHEIIIRIGEPVGG